MLIPVAAEHAPTAVVADADHMAVAVVGVPRMAEAVAVAVEEVTVNDRSFVQLIT